MKIIQAVAILLYSKQNNRSPIDSMGIKPLRSLKPRQIFSSNNFFSNQNHESSKIISAADLQYDQDNAQILYSSPERTMQPSFERQHVQCNSSQQLDNLNQYIFFMKNNSLNMDTTNLYMPHEIRQKTQGLCDQTQHIDLFYPLYEYRMQPELQARQNRGQTFLQPEIWYLILSVLNGMRQFQRIKCISSQFSINSIRFNSEGKVKIDNVMSSPNMLQRSRNQRMNWRQKNMVNYYVEETYRLAIVLLQVASMLPISAHLDEQRRREKAMRGGIMLYRMENSSNNLQLQIRRALQIVQQRYSQLLYNLLSIMLSHPRDRPLPSQIYQIFSAYKNQIMQFKQFNFNPSTMNMIRNSMMSNYSKKVGSGSFNTSSGKMGNSMGMMQNSLPLRQPMYNSLNIIDNRAQYATRQNQTQIIEQDQQGQSKQSRVYYGSNYNNQLNRVGKQDSRIYYQGEGYQPSNRINYIIMEQDRNMTNSHSFGRNAMNSHSVNTFGNISMHSMQDRYNRNNSMMHNSYQQVSHNRSNTIGKYSSRDNRDNRDNYVFQSQYPNSKYSSNESRGNYNSSIYYNPASMPNSRPAGRTSNNNSYNNNVSGYNYNNHGSGNNRSVGSPVPMNLGREQMSRYGRYNTGTGSSGAFPNPKYATTYISY